MAVKIKDYYEVLGVSRTASYSLEHGAQCHGHTRQKREGATRQLGVVVVKLTSDVPKELGLQEGRGVVVAQVQPGSAADRAGLRKGDVITGFNGTEVNDVNTFRNRVASSASTGRSAGR